MKILQVTPRYAPHIGGVETFVKELSEQLVGRGHDVVVRTADAGGAGARHESRNGVLIRRHRGVAPGESFHIAPGIATAVRRSNADLVHAHNVHSLPLPLAVAASTAPVVATADYHGGSSVRWRNALWRGYRPVAGSALRHAALVTAVSEWERESLADDFKVNATVIPIGLDEEKFAGVAPIERERSYLLCVARLEEYKGIQHVMRALSELEGFDLLVIGNGPYEHELKQIAAAIDVDEKVEFLGTLDYDELLSYYAGAEAYISLSEFESFGITVAEALASGTPCVVLESTALSEWTSRADVIGVDSVDVSTVVNAIKVAMGQNAPDQSVPTWGEVIDQYERHYESLVMP